VPQRRILLASAAGAGLAAVYSAPAAGALFALRLILRSWRPVAVLVAVGTSCIATVTAWLVSHGAAAVLEVDTGHRGRRVADWGQFDLVAADAGQRQGHRLGKPGRSRHAGRGALALVLKPALTALFIRAGVVR
jgi:hypothetical protein